MHNKRLLTKADLPIQVPLKWVLVGIIVPVLLILGLPSSGFDHRYTEANCDPSGQGARADVCLEKYVVNALKELHRLDDLSIVTAESLTAGLIASSLVDYGSGYGRNIYGGAVTYNTQLKFETLGVKDDTEIYSADCAAQMANGAAVGGNATQARTGKKALEKLVGVGVTGQAGPVDCAGLGNQTLGVVDMAISLPPLLTLTAESCGVGWQRQISVPGHPDTARATFVKRARFCIPRDEGGTGSPASISACREYTAGAGATQTETTALNERNRKEGKEEVRVSCRVDSAVLARARRAIRRATVAEVLEGVAGCLGTQGAHPAPPK